MDGEKLGADALAHSTGTTMPTANHDEHEGFKEIIYERAYRLELDSRGIRFESETTLEVKYRSWKIPGQRIDLIVEGVCWSRSRQFHG